MINVYNRTDLIDYKRPFIVAQPSGVHVLNYVACGTTFEREFESLKKAITYVNEHNINDLPDSVFYD